MNAYILIGNSNTRKSSVVRSLSGCFNRSVRDIQPDSGAAPFRLYARVGCLQESRTAASDFLLELSTKRCTAVLFCLWPNAHPIHPALCPDAQAYVSHFRAAGWTIKAIAVLGQNSGGVRSSNLLQFPNSPTLPINVTAQGVRAHFGWR